VGAHGQMVRWTKRGTHTDVFRLKGVALAPSGRQIAVAGMNIFRCADGRIAEFWQLTDTFGLALQLGALATIEQSGWQFVPPA
jgi:predicted ester cyclase